MRISIIPRYTGRETIIEVTSEHRAGDSVTTTDIGESILETICDFLLYSQAKIPGRMRLVLPKRGNVRDWLCNSQHRDSTTEARLAFQHVLDLLPHLDPSRKNNAIRQSIFQKVRRALRRIRW